MRPFRRALLALAAGASLPLRLRAQLPVCEGRHVRRLARDTLFARTRLEGGRWLITYMNDRVPESEALAKAEGL
jgi:hypothetical protein